MGVINITPNSFSDGGKYNSPDGLSSQVLEFSKWGVDVYDIGAESTAPFNAAIEGSEELARLESIFLEQLSTIPETAIISIDTYRGTTFFSIYRAIKSKRPNTQIWWNDVSGVLDDELFETLEQCPDAKYVFCHTLTSVRKNTSDHMDYTLNCKSGEEIKLIEERFNDVVTLFTSKGIESRLLLDPCFGFSKTLEQNLNILGDLPQLIESFPKEIPWVVGISKKSFFKKSIEVTTDSSSTEKQIEQMHSAYLSQLFSRVSNRQLILRVHDPSVVKNAIFISNLF